MAHLPSYTTLRVSEMRSFFDDSLTLEPQSFQQCRCWSSASVSTVSLNLRGPKRNSLSILVRFLKASKDPKYSVGQINTYPTTTYAVQVVTTLAYACTSMLLSCR